jgi:hypothetical protein
MNRKLCCLCSCQFACPYKAGDAQCVSSLSTLQGGDVRIFAVFAPLGSVWGRHEGDRGEWFGKVRGFRPAASSEGMASLRASVSQLQRHFTGRFHAEDAAQQM